MALCNPYPFTPVTGAVRIVRHVAHRFVRHPAAVTHHALNGAASAPAHPTLVTSAAQCSQIEPALRALKNRLAVMKGLPGNAISAAAGATTAGFGPIAGGTLKLLAAGALAGAMGVGGIAMAHAPGHGHPLTAGVRDLANDSLAVGWAEAAIAPWELQFIATTEVSGPIVSMGVEVSPVTLSSGSDRPSNTSDISVADKVPVSVPEPASALLIAVALLGTLTARVLGRHHRRLPD